MIGCGAQAITQLHALGRCFSLERVLLFDPDRSTAAGLPERMARVGLDRLDYEIVDTAQQAATAADILCTCTLVEPGQGPVFQDADLQPWAHINAVGSDLRGKTELPLSLLERSFVCADFIEQCLEEGDCQQLREDQISASLPELVEEPSRGHAAREGLTVFDSTGWSLADHVTAGIVILEAQRLGLGSQIAIEAASFHDPKNPYEFLDEDEATEKQSSKIASADRIARAGA